MAACSSTRRSGRGGPGDVASSSTTRRMPMDMHAGSADWPAFGQERRHQTYGSEGYVVSGRARRPQSTVRYTG
jgi:hypothetical protein